MRKKKPVISNMGNFFCFNSTVSYVNKLNSPPDMLSKYIQAYLSFKPFFIFCPGFLFLSSLLILFNFNCLFLSIFFFYNFVFYNIFFFWLPVKYIPYIMMIIQSLVVEGPSWSWSYCSWIYNYLCNQCLSSLTWVWTPLRWGVLNTTLCDKVCQ